MEWTENYRPRQDKLFNVDLNGERVATGISREAAEKYMEARRASGTGSCYIYLMDRPLEDKSRPRYRHKHPLRLPSLRVSEKEREKLTAQLKAEGILTEDSDYE